MRLFVARFLPRVISLGAFLVIGVHVFLSGFFYACHNWDEIPYVFLSTHDHCNRSLQLEHYRYLESRVPDFHVENNQLRFSAEPSYRKRALLDYEYFCSNLPFYTVKKLYVALLRLPVLFGADSLLTVRQMSAWPGLLWYIILGIVVIRALPGGVVAKVASLLLLGKIGEVLACLSSPDALACFLIAAAVVSVLLVVRKTQGNGLSDLGFNRLVVLSGVLAGLSALVRANLAVVVLVFACSLFLLVRRRVVFLFLGSACLSFLLLVRLLPDLLSGYPDSYSHLTLLMFHAGGLFGPSGDPAADIRSIDVTEVVGSLSQYKPNLSQIFRALASSVILGAQQMIACLAVIWLSAMSLSRSSSDRLTIHFFIPKNLWLISLLASFGYLFQVSVFPLAEARMIAPYITIVFAVYCLLPPRSPMSIGIHLLRVKCWFL
jgi:hypothetical protein